MIIEIVEYRVPATVDKKEVEDFVNDAVRPACKKAGYKMVRFGWTYIGGPTNIGVFIGEMDSLADLEKYLTSKEHEEFEKEVGRLFPDIEEERRILKVVE